MRRAIAAAVVAAVLAVNGWVIAAEIGDLNVTDNSNTARFPEGINAGQLNDAARALEGLLARGLKDTLDGVLTTTNGSTVTAIQITPNRALTSLYTGLTVKALFHTDIKTNATLNLASLGAKNIVWPDGKQIADAEIEQNAVLKLSYSDNKWYIQGQHTFGGATYLSGYISPTALSVDQHNWAPTGYRTASSIFVSTTLTNGVDITGFAGGTDGRILTFFFVNENDGLVDLEFPFESSSSFTYNRFTNDSEAGIEIPKCLLEGNGAVTFVYNGTIQRWMMADMVNGICGGG